MSMRTWFEYSPNLITDCKTGAYAISPRKRKYCVIEFLLLCYCHRRDLRTDKTAYLKAIKTSFNYRLVQPEKILVSREDCMQCDETSFLRFEDSFSDEVLKTTIGEASEGK